MSKKLIFIILFTALGVSCRETVKKPQDVQPKKIAVKPLEYLTYGLQREIYRQEAEQIVAFRLGFKYKSVAGCLVTEKLVDSVKLHNDTVNQILTKMHGHKWKEQFDKAVDSEIITDKMIFSILDQQALNKQSKARLRNTGYNLFYELEPIINSKYYIASAKSFISYKGHDRLVSFQRYHVDAENSVVNIVSDTLILY
ncbi:MAG: hypothetical protein EOO93_10865 [Pedobacter sp.]|nr:MAG: hypothetical protein EOO93_10865 [Pedobacter sp.]